MLIAQFSDLHYATRTLPEVDRCFAYGIERAIEADVEAAVISGDATDHALELHTPAVETLARRIQQLARHCPVVLLQGTFSHEPPGTLEVFARLAARHPIQIADRIAQLSLSRDGRWVQSTGWRFDDVPADAAAIFSCLPAVNKADVAAAMGATNAGQAVGEAVTALLAGWAPLNRRARLAGIPTIGVSHGTIAGCITEHGVPMAGLDHEFTTTALFNADASAFMLGHIHKHQCWRDGARLVAYAGSIGRLHYGEEGDKGFVLWNVYAAGATLDLVPTPARRMVHLEFAGLPDRAAIEAAAAQVRGAFVRVRWSVAEEERETVDRAAIMAALHEAAEVKLEAHVIPVVRSRAEGISRMQSLGDKLRRWAEATGVQAEGLGARFTQLQASEADAIVRELAREDLIVEFGTPAPMPSSDADSDGPRIAAVPAQTTEETAYDA